jgi:protease I
VVGLQTGDAETMNGDVNPGETFTVEKAVSEVSAGDYDGLIVPGGTVGADNLRGSGEAVAVRARLLRAGQACRRDLPRPVDAGRGGRGEGPHPHLLPSLQTDIRNAGGNWVDEEVVTDQGLVTSRNPDDLPAFCAKIVEEFRSPATKASSSAQGVLGPGGEPRWAETVGYPRPGAAVLVAPEVDPRDEQLTS